VRRGRLTHALYAGAGGIPFVPLPESIGRSDVPRSSPELYREVQDPFSGEARWAIRALRPDVALIACAEADDEGNVAFGRVPFTDRVLALASRRLVVQVECVVSSADRRAPLAARLRRPSVSAVVVARAAAGRPSRASTRRDEAELLATSTLLGLPGLRRLPERDGRDRRRTGHRPSSSP
jgi:acyl CoA:acetate/3-ketoacid CoA transferase alpha subunit